METRALERAGGWPAADRDDGEIPAIDDRYALARAQETLSDDEREAIALRFGADAKVRDVARVVGESESAVDKRIQCGLRKLRRQRQ